MATRNCASWVGRKTTPPLPKSHRRSLHMQRWQQLGETEESVASNPRNGNGMKRRGHKSRRVAMLLLGNNPVQLRVLRNSSLPAVRSPPSPPPVPRFKLCNTNKLKLRTHNAKGKPRHALPIPGQTNGYSLLSGTLTGTPFVQHNEIKK